MSNYAAGRRAEWKVRDWLLEQGAVFVARTAGSKSPADLVAVWKSAGQTRPDWAKMWDGPAWGGCLFVQVKRTKPSAKLQRGLQELATETDTEWMLVHYDRGIKSSVMFRP